MHTGLLAPLLGLSWAAGLLEAWERKERLVSWDRYGLLAPGREGWTPGHSGLPEAVTSLSALPRVRKG